MCKEELSDECGYRSRARRERNDPAHAWTAIRWKHDVERFRGWHFRLLGVVLFVLGLVVLAAGVASGRALTVLFSWIGLVYGAVGYIFLDRILGVFS